MVLATTGQVLREQLTEEGGIDVRVRVAGAAPGKDG